MWRQSIFLNFSYEMHKFITSIVLSILAKLSHNGSLQDAVSNI